MEKGLVSVVMPCYNQEKRLFRMMDSLLAQTYRKMQVIAVDDGSTDGTAKAIQAYIPQFEAAGIQLEYHYQENGGLSAAINCGLRFVRGEFLCWPDPDDWFSPDAMEKRVAVLNDHPEYAVVTCDADCYREADMSLMGGVVSGKAEVRFEEKQFQLLLEGRSMFCSLSHMVRTEAFLDTHPDGQIYDSRFGQNMQMLLPLYYKYKRCFIDEALCHYLVAENSMSRSINNFEKKLAHRNAFETLTIETLKRIDMPDDQREKHIHDTLVRNTRKRLLLAKAYKNKAFGKEQVIALKKLKSLTAKDIWTFITI